MPTAAKGKDQHTISSEKNKKKGLNLEKEFHNLKILANCTLTLLTYKDSVVCESIERRRRKKKGEKELYVRKFP